jgi:hypothetical protein
MRGLPGHSQCFACSSNPRRTGLEQALSLEGEKIVPLTPTRRVTVAALAMNRPFVVAIRQEESARGRHSPM